MKDAQSFNIRNNALILNHYFIVGLVILICNDMWLKWGYHNYLTGKLSDFAGLFIFPMFLAYVFPRIKKQAAIITGIGFFLWKLPVAGMFINWVNLNPFFQINRVADYSDYSAFLVLPFSHRIIERSFYQPLYSNTYIKIVGRYAVIAASLMAFTATSYARYIVPKGTVFIGKYYTLRLGKEDILKHINDIGYTWEYVAKDTVDYTPGDYYQLNHFIVDLYDGPLYPATRDTIDNIKFRLIENSAQKTKLFLINVTLKNPGNIQSWQYLKAMNKRYRKVLKKELIKELKK